MAHTLPTRCVLRRTLHTLSVLDSEYKKFTLKLCIRRHCTPPPPRRTYWCGYRGTSPTPEQASPHTANTCVAAGRAGPLPHTLDVSARPQMARPGRVGTHLVSCQTGTPEQAIPTLLIHVLGPSVPFRLDTRCIPAHPGRALCERANTSRVGGGGTGTPGPILDLLVKSGGGGT